jgi:hypothetical protein
MGKTFPEIDESLRKFIGAQQMFFVATAPLSGGGRVNLSPKGLDTFRVLSPLLVGYADYTGSGVETIAHIRENGRLTIMFCAFAGAPNIVRLYGKGRVVESAEAEFDEFLPRFGPVATVRSIILLDITRITDSCGWGVPLYQYQGQREQLVKSAETKGADGLATYQKKRNAASIDGLPGLRSACGS